MSLFSPLLAICFDPEEANAVADLARNLGYPDAQLVTGGIKEAVAALNARTLSPHYILLDIGNRGTDIYDELDEFALHCEPGVRVVVIGALNDLTFYRELKQRGVLEYFTRPVPAVDIRSVLINAPSYTQAGAPAAQQGFVLSCMSAASGDGGSTIALNLAWCLAEEFKQPTVLVDMDYQFGLVTKSLDIHAPFGIRELFDHPDRGLDLMLVTKMLVGYGENLKIVAAPQDLKLLPTIRPELIRELVAILRTQFTFVIIDVPHVWTDWTAAAIGYCDQSLMVAQLWLRSLTHATRLMAAWQSIGIPGEAVSLIINRSGAKFKEALTAQDFERICHHKIDAYVNNDIKAMVNAENAGKTLFETGQGSLIQQQIKQFAQTLITRHHGRAALKATQSITGKKKLLALFDRKSGMHS